MSVDIPLNIAVKIPELYSSPKIPVQERYAWIKLYVPGTDLAWYVCEYDGFDLCMGYIVGEGADFNFFSLSEIRKHPTATRDRQYKPRLVIDIVANLDA